MPRFFESSGTASAISQLKKRLLLLALIAISFQVNAFCFEEAGNAYKINPNILKAISKHESGNRAGLVLKNANGSLDIGLTRN